MESGADNEMVVRSDSVDPVAPLTVKELVGQAQLAQRVLKTVMREGVHYGHIPGCDKPILFQAGAEKLLQTFRIRAEAEVEDLSDEREVRIRTVLRGVLPNGQVVGMGVGECSSSEEKYAWRKAVCEAEYEAALENERRVKFFRNGGSVQQVRVNPAGVRNTILRMSYKRAFVHMARSVTAASDIFETDIEDIPEEILEGRAPSGSSDRPTRRRGRPRKPEPSAPELPNPVQVQVLDVGEKHSPPSSERKWTVYFVKTDKGVFGTFDENLAQSAIERIGEEIIVTWEAGKRKGTRNLVEFRAVEESAGDEPGSSGGEDLSFSEEKIE